MIIVIALTPSHVWSHRHLNFFQSLCRNRGNHTIIFTLDGFYTEAIDCLRNSFEGILPQENIRLWYKPAGNAIWHGQIGNMILHSFLESLQADIVLEAEDAAVAGPISFKAPFGTINATATNLEQQAREAFNTLEEWHAQAAPAPLLSLLPKLRPKLAYLSPLPPEHSGISDYSAELLPELSRYYEIDVFVAQKKMTDLWIRENCAVRPVSWFKNNASKYDRVLYHIGNSPFHFHMFDLLAEVPGIAVLHDFFLSDILEYRDSSGLAPGSFPSEIYRSHGYPAMQRLSAADHGLGDVVATYPCNFSVLQHAIGIIFHSEYAASLATTWYGSRLLERSTIIPLLRSPAHSYDRSEARKALGFGHSDVVVCSFGLPGPHKMSHKLLEAWQASSLFDDDQCTLLFVGELPLNDYGRTLQNNIEQSGGRIRMTGWVPIDEYRRYLCAADIGVQLRSLSRGESSASALDCMNYGLATIVNANGSMTELPTECVMMLPDDVTVEQLKKVLETLRADVSLRERVGYNARTFVHTERSPVKAAEQYAAAIEKFLQSPETIRHRLLQKIAHHETIPDDKTALFSIAEAIHGTFPSQCSGQQLLIDVSALAENDLKTGIQRVVRSVVMELLEHPPEGFRVEPVFMEQGEQGLFYRYARKFTLNILGADEQSCSLFSDEPVDYLSGDIFLGLDLCHNVQHGLTFFESFRRKGGRVYFVVYDLLPLQFPHFFPPNVYGDHKEWMNMAAQGDGVVCISRAVADHFREWFDQVKPHRCRPFKIGWFHLGADIAKSLPTGGFPEGFDKEMLTLAKSPSILMVGTVEPRKGHALVLSAFEILWMTGMRVNLVVIGKKGWMVEQIAKRMAKHKQLKKRLFWYQGISDEALQRLYKAADGMVMASEGEGFGLPLIEAAQYGCPILARDLPIFREVAGEHAAYFSANSPLKLAISLKSWIGNLKKGSAPQSSGIPWLTWKESVAGIVHLLTDDRYDQWIYRWKPVSQQKKAAEDKPVRKSPKCIAVDLTLVLPGGENGGAKVFMLELLRLLAEMKPDTQFILLTRQSSHNELAYLDRRNMRRVIKAADPTPPPSTEGKRPEKGAGLIRRFSAWAERTGKGWKRSFKKRIKRIKPDRADSDKTLREMGVDLLYCPFTALDYAEPGIPAVCTVYDLQYKTYPEFFSPEEVAYRERVFMDACHHATQLTAISDYSRQSAIIHSGINPSRIRTISLRMAHRILSSNEQKKDESDELFARLNLERQLYLLFPANFWQHKNHEILLTAFAIAIRHGLTPKMKLVCTGAPTERQRAVIKKSAAIGLADRVIFPGYLPNDELAAVLANAAGMIFPSLYEGFGLPVIEAMAAGIPVACSNTRALPEVTSGAALLFNPDNPEEIAQAMVSLTSDEPLRTTLIKDGLLRAQEFSDQKRMAHEYWELFEDSITLHSTHQPGSWAKFQGTA